MFKVDAVDEGLFDVVNEAFKRYNGPLGDDINAKKSTKEAEVRADVTVTSLCICQALEAVLRDNRGAQDDAAVCLNWLVETIRKRILESTVQSVRLATVEHEDNTRKVVLAQNGPGDTWNVDWIDKSWRGKLPPVIDMKTLAMRSEKRA